MKEYLSKVKYETIQEMTVMSKVIISQNPEEEVVAYMHDFMEKNNIPLDSRQFGFDYPVSEKESVQGLRGYEYWVVVDKEIQDDAMTIKKIPTYKYISLRIKDPFVAPFERIPSGWQALVKQIEDNHLESSIIKDGNCLEEVMEIDGITYMDVLIPIS